MAYFTYMVLCSDNSLYTGFTNDLEKRIQTHNSGKGAKYTRTRLPVQLVYWESYATKQEALSREAHLKRWSRAQKLQLLSEDIRKQILEK